MTETRNLNIKNMKKSTYFVGTCIAAFAFCAFPAVATATTVQGFESGLPPGSTMGDAFIVGTFEGIAPPEGTHQLLLSTINNNTGSDPGTLTFSGTNAVDVTPLAAFAANGHGGVTISTLRFDALHTGREGSAFQVTLSLQVGDILTFKYDFLTAEDPFASPANEDFGFASLVNNGLSGAASLTNYQILGHQTTATNNTAQSPFFSETGTSGNHFSTYTFSITTAGSYTLTIGVMDAQSKDGISGLLIDNLAIVPEPSALGLGFAGAVLLIALRGRFKKS